MQQLGGSVCMWGGVLTCVRARVCVLTCVCAHVCVCMLGLGGSHLAAGSCWVAAFVTGHSDETQYGNWAECYPSDLFSFKCIFFRQQRMGCEERLCFFVVVAFSNDCISTGYFLCENLRYSMGCLWPLR